LGSLDFFDDDDAIERHAMVDVNTAIERLRKNQVRYRAVLVS
jgi:D-arabinose 1-dehydrogenase-like Zn-dependent alcohol dehydrogenase